VAAAFSRGGELSVSLVIEWKDGEPEVIPVAGQRAAMTTWREIGSRLGLKWVVGIASFVPVNEETLEPLIAELEGMLVYVGANPTFAWVGEDVERLRDALIGLRHSGGWEASIG
jgi:hypothetical protein